MVKHIEKCALKFEADIHKWLKSKRFATQLEEELKVLRGEGQRYPPKVRPFKAPVELGELDNVLKDCKDAECTLTIKFDQGRTRRQCMETAHHRLTTFMKGCHAEAQAEHLAGAELRTRKATFLKSCYEFKDPEEALDSLGLEEPTRSIRNTELLQRKLETTYTSVIDRVRNKVAVETKATEEARAKSASEKDELAKVHPGEVLDTHIQTRVEAALSKHGIGDTSGDTVMDITAPDPKALDELFTNKFSSPKNGSGPAAARAQEKNGPTHPKETSLAVTGGEQWQRERLEPCEQRSKRSQRKRQRKQRKGQADGQPRERSGDRHFVAECNFAEGETQSKAQNKTERQRHNSKVRRSVWKDEVRKSYMEQRSNTLFNFMIDGANFEDWQFVANLGTHQQTVRRYDHASRSVVMADIAWPLAWILTRFNRKHIFCSRALPNRRKFLSAVETFINKMKWRWLYRNSTDEKSLIRYRHIPTPTCNFPVDITFQLWCDGLRRSLIVSFRRCLSRASGDRSYANTIALNKWGMDLLHQYGYVCAPNDKEAGFSLLSVKDFLAVQKEVLTSDGFEYVDYINRESLHGDFHKLCMRVGKVEGNDRWQASCYRSWTAPRATLCASLVLLCKTHKAPGMIKFRDVHANTAASLQGLSIWLGEQCYAQLDAKVSHILKSSTDLVNRLHKIQCPPGSFLMRIDLDHFYASGSANELVDSVKPA